MMSVPRLYENLQKRILDAAAKAPPLQRRLFHWALAAGSAYSERRRAGQRVPPWLALRHALADRLVLQKVRARTGGRIRFFISGGAALPADTAQFLFALGYSVLQGYGLTETSPVVSVNRPEAPRLDTIGLPLPGVQVRLEPDGEICVKGPTVMKGYWGEPEETAAVMDADGWFHTGDVGEMTPEGHLRITDRKKNILVLSSGKNVAPQPIEARLKASPYIAEVVLLGDRRPTVGALIVPNFDALRAREGMAERNNADLAADPEVRQLIRNEIDRLSEDLAEFEQVKRFVLLDRELTLEAGEMTPTLKTRRAVILQHFADAVRQLYGESPGGG
jgi:long-chain acyl-CoA synthetase